MRYFVLSTPGGEEVARLSRDSASYFEVTTGRWIPDPLLAVEVKYDEGWREVDLGDLPTTIAETVDQPPRSRWFRSPRRGRHSRP